MIQEPGADNGLYRRLILLALPIMAANLLQTLYNLADTFFLGRLGKEAVSAPSIAFNMIFFLVVFGTGFSSAGTTLISQAKGRGMIRRWISMSGRPSVSCCWSRR